MTSEKRLDWADIARGIGIIFVVFAHTIIPQMRVNSRLAGFLWIFIYNFHMPLFFFISGLLFERNLSHYCNKCKFILKKLEYLMLPYLVFSVFAYIFIALAMQIAPFSAVLKSGGYHITGIKEAVFQILFYSGHADQHLWFVYSLFLVFLANILLPRLFRSKLFLLVLLALYISKAYIQYPAILNYTAGDLLFFSLARVIYADGKELKIKSTAFAGITVLFVALSSVYSFFYITEMPSGVLKGVLYFIRSIASVSGILVFCRIAHYLSGRRMGNLLQKLGGYSYDIYLMHAPFLVSGSMGILMTFTPLPEWVCSFSVLVIGLSMPYAVSRFIIRKTPILSVPLLGRRY